MQICDNKEWLGRIFKLDKEVVGFDSVEEAIDLCRYYLEHEEERRTIAAAGWERALSDYNEGAVFRILARRVDGLAAATHRRQSSPATLNSLRSRLSLLGRIRRVRALPRRAVGFARRAIRP
jgi:hypothetical protein